MPAGATIPGGFAAEVTAAVLVTGAGTLAAAAATRGFAAGDAMIGAALAPGAATVVTGALLTTGVEESGAAGVPVVVVVVAAGRDARRIPLAERVCVGGASSLVGTAAAVVASMTTAAGLLAAALAAAGLTVALLFVAGAVSGAAVTVSEAVDPANIRSRAETGGGLAVAVVEIFAAAGASHTSKSSNVMSSCNLERLGVGAALFSAGFIKAELTALVVVGLLTTTVLA